MRTTGWMLLLACIACGDNTPQTQAGEMLEDGYQGSSLVLDTKHQFNIKSAAFDITETGLTRSITLVASDQADVCRDLLEGRRHRNERRLGMVGLTGGSTPLTSQFTVMQPGSIPRQGASMLVVSAFYELNQQCSNLAPRVISGAMTVFNADRKSAHAAYYLQTTDGAAADLTGAISAKYCKGIRDAHRTTTYRTCVD